MRMFRRLEGLFCVYKPAGVHWKRVRDTIETNLLKGVNDTPACPLPREIRFLSNPNNEAGAAGELTLRAASLPVLSKHPLVLAVGNGNRTLNDLYSTRTTRDYTLECEFGTATHDFTHTGRVVERSTYGHITQDKMERVIAMLEGANQKALRMYSSVDMSSQEAYELARKGLLGPDRKSVPVLTGLRCVHFQPPNFTLEVQCLNETQKYLRKVVHEIGLELRSTAVCKGVRRTRDGLFTLQEALIRHHWNAADIQLAIQEWRSKKRRKRRSGTPTDKALLQTAEEALTVSQENEANEQAMITEVQCS